MPCLLNRETDVNNILLIIDSLALPGGTGPVQYKHEIDLLCG